MYHHWTQECQLQHTIQGGPLSLCTSVHVARLIYTHLNSYSDSDLERAEFYGMYLRNNVFSSPFCLE